MAKVERKNLSLPVTWAFKITSWVSVRGGVEDTRLKAKNTKKSEAKAKDRNARGQGQGPRTQTQVFSEKKAFKIFFSAISKKNGLEKYFLADL